MSVWRRLLRDPWAVAGLLGLALVVLLAVAAPVVDSRDPVQTNLALALQAPSRDAWLGRDSAGRDVLARLLFGGRASLGAAAVVLAGTMLISLLVGGISGYVGGFVDVVVMRIVDVWLAIPRLVLAITLAALLQPGLTTLIVAVLAVSWAPYCQIVRGLILRNKHYTYVEAMAVLGASPVRVLGLHLLPSLLGEVVVLMSLEVGQTVLILASLSFVGLGIQPPAPEWGAMLNEARPYVSRAPLLMLAPGVCIALVVLASTLISDGVRDALDRSAG